MSSHRADDKAGQALNAQRFQMLEDIAKELSGDVAFPTCFAVAMQLRKALSDPNQSIEQIGRVIIGDPLICGKLLGLANSVAFNPSGTEVTDIKNAIQRLGLNAVRSCALAVAMKQMLMSKGMVEFEDLTKDLWDHSIVTASAAYVVARRLSRLSADDAMLAGLVHDIGVFYMLYRATQYDELRARPESLKHLVMQWHESIGETLLNALGVPEKITLSIRDHDQPRPNVSVKTSLNDVVHVANVLAGGIYEWLLQDMDAADQYRGNLDAEYLELLPEIQEHAQSVRAAFN